ncbi:LpqN/LpqT family lipoprotein [Mycolicibacterium mengxianglii]|uniref:LpqN/LpqT family lipoprotein n=1 Tax=Mycolicibacterium mengxianglii TaxID=2736649 RepID=UPI0018EEF720|nr:LpqN/LpqT family lipoprotein [Mycolicibacterium mengxianglii]
MFDRVADRPPGLRILVSGVAAGIVGMIGLAGGTASAEPALPLPPAPTPVAESVIVQQAGVTPVPAGVPVQPPAAATVNLTPQPQLAPSLPTAAGPAVTAPVAPALVPATSGTIKEFLAGKGVTLEPQDPRTFSALHITLPMPRGWSQVPDPNVPDAFAVIADRVGGDGLYTSNAQVIVYKLAGGDFDATEAITHGFIDSQQLANWQSTDASLASYGGFPSSLIEGAYRQNDMMLNTSRRHVLASSGPDKYLVSLSVTTAVNQAIAAADATDAIVNGFRVTGPAPAAPAAAPLPAPAAPPA